MLARGRPPAPALPGSGDFQGKGKSEQYAPLQSPASKNKTDTAGNNSSPAGFPPGKCTFAPRARPMERTPPVTPVPGQGELGTRPRAPSLFSGKKRRSFWGRFGGKTKEAHKVGSGT